MFMEECMKCTLLKVLNLCKAGVVEHPDVKVWSSGKTDRERIGDNAYGIF